VPEPLVDLRSDTVTKPSAGMRKAMHDCEVGDDVYREDPTINRLQDRAAEIFGRAAGLFVVSGTMGNQTAIKVLTHHGQDVICEDRSHIYNFEMDMVTAFSGVLPRTIHAEDGILNWDLIAPHVRGRNDHRARTGVIELENTSNLAGGSVYPLAIADDIVDHAHAAGIPVCLASITFVHQRQLFFPINDNYLIPFWRHFPATRVSWPEAEGEARSRSASFLSPTRIPQAARCS
jgi:threonine aldolase